MDENFQDLFGDFESSGAGLSFSAKFRGLIGILAYILLISILIGIICSSIMFIFSEDNPRTCDYFKELL